MTGFSDVNRNMHRWNRKNKCTVGTQLSTIGIAVLMRGKRCGVVIIWLESNQIMLTKVGNPP